MAMASLSLKFNNDVVTLETGTLRYIDSIIKSFSSSDELKISSMFKDKLIDSSFPLNDAKVVLTYIKNNNEKVLLKPIYNDKLPIRTRAKAIEDEKSEVEKARKLMFSSRNKLFLLMFLNNQSLIRTTYSKIKISKKENECIKKEGLVTFMKDGEFYTTIKDVLLYHLNHKKLGRLRLLVEDSLESWKSNMLDLAEEDLYFHSRELRLLINEYNYRKIPRKAVYNLIINKNKLKQIPLYHINKVDNTYNDSIKYKRKTLD